MKSNRNFSTNPNRPSGFDRRCTCVRCDVSARKEYLKLRFPDGMVDFDQLEKSIPGKELVEGLCSSLSDGATDLKVTSSTTMESSQ